MDALLFHFSKIVKIINKLANATKRSKRLKELNSFKVNETFLSELQKCITNCYNLKVISKRSSSLLSKLATKP